MSEQAFEDALRATLRAAGSSDVPRQLEDRARAIPREVAVRPRWWPSVRLPRARAAVGAILVTVIVGTSIVLVAPRLSPAAAPGSSLVALGPGIAVPADELRPIDKCMLDAGFQVVAVHPSRSGSNGIYSWSTTTSYIWTAAASTATAAARVDCRSRFAPPHEQTPAEVRAIYEHWVLEWQCLLGLGLHPIGPPSFEEFLATWSTGPWMPIDGLTPYELAGSGPIDHCGLEMLD